MSLHLIPLSVGTSFSLRILGAGFSTWFLSVTASKSGACLAIHVSTNSEITEVTKIALPDCKLFCYGLFRHT